MKSRLLCWIPSLISIICIVSVVVVVLAKMKGNHDSPKSKKSNYNFTWILDKNDWGGLSSFNLKQLDHPVPLVIISHTFTKFCRSINECSQVLRQIQAEHMEQGYFDIGYNYLIGGDGNIYTGRGIEQQNFHANHQNHSVGISFVGNFQRDALTGNMLSALAKLLNCLQEFRKIRKKYAIVGQNQTAATDSPGTNVYKSISELRHFVDQPLHNGWILSNDSNSIVTKPEDRKMEPLICYPLGIIK